MGAVTVITSGKGGVGKSTVTAGLGGALARRGKRVLLMDMETGLRGLERMMGADELLVFDSADIVFGNCEPLRAVYPCPPFPGLFLLPAASTTEDALSETTMRRLISTIAPYFDHILIDSPAGVGADFRVAACAADAAMVVVNPDPVGLRCGSTVNRLLGELGVENRRLVINRFSPDAFLKAGYYRDLDDVIDATGIRLIAVIPEDVNLSRAAADGRPCLPGLPGTMAFDRMAARMDGETIPVMI